MVLKRVAGGMNLQLILPFLYGYWGGAGAFNGESSEAAQQGRGGPSCKRTVAKGWLKRREIDLESKEPFMMNGRGWIEGKVVERTKVGRASAEEQASRDPNGTQ